MKLASLMTLQEYIENVTPLFKEFNKFMKKNGQYFRKADYYGVKHLTFPEYIEEENKRLIAQGYESLIKNDYAEERWMEPGRGDVLRTKDAVPANIKKTYDDLIERFKEFFTEDEIERRIERDELKSNKRAIRRAIDKDVYIDALKDGVVTPARLVEIFDSVGIKIPRRILELKSKVETTGYNRQVELAQAKTTKEFENVLRKELGPHYDELKDSERVRVNKIVDQYENFENKGGDFYHFLKQYDKFESYKNYVSHILGTLYEGKYDDNLPKTVGKKQYLQVKRSDFEKRIEEICTDFAESFIRLFVHRIELKLRVVTSKLGTPTLKLSNVKFSMSEFEGWVEATFPDKTVINIQAQVITAGGYNIQVIHYRYLLKTFYKGKFIDLEDIDALNFK